MSDINAEVIKHTAHLARIDIDEENQQKFAEKLDNILDYVHRIDELDLEDVEPKFHALELANIMRDDVAMSPISQEDALKNAKSTQDGQFKVPRMI